MRKRCYHCKCLDEEDQPSLELRKKIFLISKFYCSKCHRDHSIPSNLALAIIPVPKIRSCKTEYSQEEINNMAMGMFVRKRPPAFNISYVGEKNIFNAFYEPTSKRDIQRAIDATIRIKKEIKQTYHFKKIVNRLPRRSFQKIQSFHSRYIRLRKIKNIS